jgi:hypothetical protein
VPPTDRLTAWQYGFLIIADGLRYLQANPVFDEDWPPSHAG